MIVRNVQSSVFFLVFLSGTHQLFEINLNISRLMNNLIIITFLFLNRLLLFLLMFNHASLWLILLTLRLILTSRLTLLIFLIRHLMYWTGYPINDSTAESTCMIALRSSSLILWCFSRLAPFLWSQDISLIGHLDSAHFTHVYRI